MDLVSRTYVDRVAHAQPKTGIRDRNEQGLLVEKMFFAPIRVKFVLDKPFHRTASEALGLRKVWHHTASAMESNAVK